MTELCTLIQYLLLGSVQGITEPIPISSSGHIIIVRELFAIEARGLSFEIFVNFASLLAVLLIYRHDFYRLIKNGILFITKKDEQAKTDLQFTLYLVIGTILVGVIDLLFEDGIVHARRHAYFVGFT